MSGQPRTSSRSTFATAGQLPEQWVPGGVSTLIVLVPVRNWTAGAARRRTATRRVRSCHVRIRIRHLMDVTVHGQLERSLVAHVYQTL